MRPTAATTRPSATGGARTSPATSGTRSTTATTRGSTATKTCPATTALDIGCSSGADIAERVIAWTPVTAAEIGPCATATATGPISGVQLAAAWPRRANTNAADVRTITAHKTGCSTGAWLQHRLAASAAEIHAVLRAAADVA